MALPNFENLPIEKMDKVLAKKTQFTQIYTCTAYKIQIELSHFPNIKYKFFHSC